MGQKISKKSIEKLSHGVKALCAIIFLYKHVLKKEVGDLGDVIWAKKPQKLPEVFTQAEAQDVVANLEGVYWIISVLMHGSGMRLIECLRLRVKDIDFASKKITVRSGKGEKDRITLLPEIVIPDLQAGFGTVYLPYALERKYANANREWIWQPVGC
jgi:integrase